jgi:hypothetical protein
MRGVLLPEVLSVSACCRFTWKRNDVDITYNMTDVRKQPGSGTLVIESPTPAYEGVYQCFARNNYGLAVSVKTLLKPAGQFSDVSQPITISNTKLVCYP